MGLDLDTKLRQGQDHIATTTGSETAMMSIIRGRYYAVGGVAERIWEMLAAPATPREIIAQLQDEYEITQEQCEREVTVLLADLFEEGLVVEDRP